MLLFQEPLLTKYMKVMTPEILKETPMEKFEEIPLMPAEKAQKEIVVDMSMVMSQDLEMPVGVVDMMGRESCESCVLVYDLILARVERVENGVKKIQYCFSVQAVQDQSAAGIMYETVERSFETFQEISEVYDLEQNLRFRLELVIQQCLEHC